MKCFKVNFERSKRLQTEPCILETDSLGKKVACVQTQQAVIEKSKYADTFDIIRRDLLVLENYMATASVAAETRMRRRGRWRW